MFTFINDKLISFIDYFKSESLYINSKKITLFPYDNLHSRLTYINCSNNKLTELPNTLPNNLEYLNCNNNKLTELPNILPVNLIELHCYNNNLTSLPDILPNNLRKLYCYNNKLTSLPDIIPNNIKYLYCNDNNLTSLPKLPNNMECLIVQNNDNLSILPEHLPMKLQHLSCSINQISEEDIKKIPTYTKITVYNKNNIIKEYNYCKMGHIMGWKS